MKFPQWTGRAGSVLTAAVGLFVLVCLLTYDPADVPLLSSHPQVPPHNLGGALGVWVGFAGRGLFGGASMLWPALALAWAWQLWRGVKPQLHAVSLTLAFLCWLVATATLAALPGQTDGWRTQLGGLTGYVLARTGSYYLGVIGTLLTAACVAVLSWLVISAQLLGTSGLRLLTQWLLSWRRGSTDAAPAPALRPAVRKPAKIDEKDVAAGEEEATPLPTPPPPRSLPAAPRVLVRSTAEPKPKAAAPRRPQIVGDFHLPSLDLLTTPPPVSQRQLTEDLQKNARVLEETLREFGIEATVVNIDRGPAVTRYELTPAPGVKLTKIVALADDLALVLKAANCHVIAPIPGKGRVGVDVPNSIATTVYLKEIISAPDFAKHPSPIVLPIGKDVSGHAILTDLRECPHLLVAGATGSGKTVCLNSLLIGILMRSSPEQVKLLMIDPKMVEMAMFNEIPHLVAPVVTNAKKAAMALGWAVREMERRYKLLAKKGARNIDGYNERLKLQPAPVKPPEPAAEGAAAGEDEEDLQDDGRPLPYIVIVVDELADLMMVAAQDVEGLITRLAQLSRAVGIHMILATQRPSVDVITGVIKANFPARIAFQVASKVDSRTILDMNGADKLLGRGDLMFLKPGAAKPTRAQGAFLTDGEIEQITNFLKQQRAPTYDERFIEQTQKPEGMMAEGERDEMYETAKQLVLDTGQASTSLLQRRLRLGYGRAARILDLMEQEGLVGPPQGSRPREVLVTRDALKESATK